MLNRLINSYSRRPFPSNYKALKCMRVSYSQFAEDLMVSNILGYEKQNGYYVDVGCNHPINYSNTYLFYQRGYRGICIDPNAFYTNHWKKYRPKDSFGVYGIGTKNEELNYIKYKDYPECNRIVTGKELNLLDTQGKHPSYSKSTIKVKKLVDVLLSYKWFPQRFDYLNVDCEHLDLDVIKSNDFTRFRPTVISVEDLFEDDKNSEIYKYLENLDYEKKGQFGLSKIFVDQSYSDY